MPKVTDNKMEEKPVLATIDESIHYTGDFHFFQKRLTGMFCIMMLPSVYQLLIMVFGAHDPPWRCVANR